MNNPDSRKIDIRTKEGLELLRIKAKYYGHYAEFLKIVELIDLVEELQSSIYDKSTADQTGQGTGQETQLAMAESKEGLPGEKSKLRCLWYIEG
jgi:hypothetical protein